MRLVARGRAFRLLMLRGREPAIVPTARGLVALADTGCLANVEWALLPVQKRRMGTPARSKVLESDKSVQPTDTRRTRVSNLLLQRHNLTKKHHLSSKVLFCRRMW